MKRHNISAALAALLIAAVLCGGCENAPAPAAPAETTTAVTTEAVTPEAPEEPESPADTGVPESYTPRSERLECLYYVDTDFHLYDGRSSAYEMNGELLCGVAPHHLTAGHMIAGLYKTAAEHCPDIETVVLIAPMHYDTENTLTTSMKGWNTAFGAVQNDTEITALFRSRLGAAADDYMTEFDHSASSHIPFIKRYLPDAKVSCLLVSPKEHRDIPERLSELLYEISQTKKCFFAFSIDFSHYLDPDVAQQHDKETRSAVLGGDTERIERFTNQNVDTPYGLSAFVRLSKLLGAAITEADNGNTYSIGEKPYNRTTFPEGVTSYFVFLSTVRGSAPLHDAVRRPPKARRTRA